MESLSETLWDVLIAGTGLPQSLLALALSRSGKKVLHVDGNRYYGGSDAALTFEEVQQWRKNVNSGASQIFGSGNPASSEEVEHLSLLQRTSRSYSINLLPQIVYARSDMLKALVSSQLHSQLEFLAVGSFWILGDGQIRRIPNAREDVFADESLSRRNKMCLMKFLRYVSQEPMDEIEVGAEAEAEVTLASVLTSKFGLEERLHAPILALATSLCSPTHTRWLQALPRIRRHLQSIGMFGVGFGAVLPKYGGKAEIAQVACRAGAVGGGVYVLGSSVQSMAPQDSTDPESCYEVTLSSAEKVRARHVVGSVDNLPLALGSTEPSPFFGLTQVTHSISIISKPLTHLFPPISDNGPPPAVAVVIAYDGQSTSAPIYFQVHSEDTGECPIGQCIVYASTIASTGESDERLSYALQQLLECSSEVPKPQVLWSTSYYARCRPLDSMKGSSLQHDERAHSWCFPPPTDDIAVEDNVLADVRTVWKAVMEDEVDLDEFLRFEMRTADDE